MPGLLYRKKDLNIHSPFLLSLNGSVIKLTKVTSSSSGQQEMKLMIMFLLADWLDLPLTPSPDRLCNLP